MEENIKKILEIAVYAPSGENIQPWQFSISENRIDVLNVPDADTSLYNFRQSASLIAHGALLENIEIAAPAFGYCAQSLLFPEKDNTNHIVSIVLQRISTKEDELYSCIKKRATNRKKYDGRSLNEAQKANIINAGIEVGEGRVVLLDGEKNIKTLSKTLSLNEQLVFEVKELHRFFFSHMRWNEKEERKQKNGLYLKTLELKPPQVAAFHIFRHWKVVKLFNKIGFSKLVAKDNEKTYATSSAFGVIVVPGNTPKDFVIAGRILQRIWLKATRMGLSIQPSTGVPFFMERISGGDAGKFSHKQIEQIKQAYNTIKETCGILNEVVTMPFRIGYGGEPSARSSRLSPEISHKD